MTPAQYEHWCDFAIRMARTCYADHKRPGGQEILDWVMEFLERWSEDYVHVKNWDQSDDWDYVCDDFHSWEDDYCPNFWWRIHDELVDESLDWEAREATASERAEKAQEQWTEQFMGPVRCCIRSALDMATEIGGGVVGFTLGDVRAMYPEGIPPFVRRHYEDDRQIFLDDLQDQEPIWL